MASTLERRLEDRSKDIKGFAKGQAAMSGKVPVSLHPLTFRVVREEQSCRDSSKPAVEVFSTRVPLRSKKTRLLQKLILSKRPERMMLVLVSATFRDLNHVREITPGFQEYSK